MAEHTCAQARRLARGALRAGRREVLAVGALGALGLTAADALALEKAASAGRCHSAILLWLTGGPSQFDSFDPKPDAPAEVRGPFKAIDTAVDGIRFTEVFPKTARHARKLAVLRSVHHPLDHHVLAQGWMTAGRVHDTLNYPPMGSLVARLAPRDPLIPSFVTLPRMKLIDGFTETQHSQTAGDLGAAWNPVIPDGVPGETGFAVRDLPLPGGVDGSRFSRRSRLLERVNLTRGLEPTRSPRREMQALYERAFDLIHSRRVEDALDLAKEPDRLRDAYGRNGFGQATLLARRLIEAGTRYVTVNWPSYYAWDHHGSIEGGMKSTGGWLDAALSALLEDLEQRGLLERTLVLVMGEFGRTPKINASAGRDHWVHVMSVLMAGARIRGGQLYGSSTADGYADDRPLHARDMVATAYAALGIDPETEVETVIGRPIRVLPDAEPVAALLR
jgi:hypothetical protein